MLSGWARRVVRASMIIGSNTVDTQVKSAWENAPFIV